MSYDIVLFPVPAGEKVATVFARRTEAESEEINPGPMVDSIEVAKKRVSDALQDQLPRLQRFPFDYALIARELGTDTAEARRRWRHIELNEDKSGLQITIHDSSVAIALPYWHSGEAAEDAFRELWKCVGVVQEHTGYTAYDPQLDREIQGASGTDRSDGARRYTRTKAAVEKMIHNGEHTRPWWKFW